jgi:putative membrane protein
MMNGYCLAAAVALWACAGMSDGLAAPASASGTATAATAPASAADYVRQAALSDMYEVQASRLALDRATSPSVKSFAQQMVTDHTATTNGLKATLASANLPATPPTALDARRVDMLGQLSRTSGGDFDRLYLQQQGAAHQEALLLHTAYAQGGDTPPLRTFAGQAAGRVQMHIDMLRQLGSP